MPLRSIHVVPSTRGWAVERELRGKGQGGVAHYHSQEEALAAGRQMAEEEKVELVIHGRDGKVRERSDYSRSPNSPRSSISHHGPGKS